MKIGFTLRKLTLLSLLSPLIGASFTANAAPLCRETQQPESVAIPQQERIANQIAKLSAEQVAKLQKVLAIRLSQYLLQISNITAPELFQQKSIRPDQVADLGQAKTTVVEEQLLMLLAAQAAEGNLGKLLQNTLDQALKIAAKRPGLKERVEGLTPEKKGFVLGMLNETVTSTLRLRGLMSDTNVKYEEWQSYSKRVTESLDKVKGRNIIEKMENASGSKLVSGKQVRLLVDGPESFPLREKLMSEAAQSIDVMSWAIYDDATGAAAVDLLVQKHQQGLRVRVIVDGQISQRPGYGAEVTRLEQAGVPVIRWNNPTRRFEGQHRKMMVIDGEHVIGGGMNFGDVYSHKVPETSHWRDTDLYFQGSTAAVEAQNLFTSVWNEQVKVNKLKHQTSKLLSAKKTSKKEADAEVKMLVIDSRPSTSPEGSPIAKAMLTAIRNSTKSVDVENAYVILFPAIRDEMVAAAKRGVKVRVFSNSTKSVDEPIVSLPIQRSMKDLAANGVRTFLKNGETLHSKMLVIDGEITMVMSYNLHPRSERVEEEMAIVVFSRDFAKDVTRVIERDLATSATEVTDDQIPMPNDRTALLSLRLFYDQL